MNILYRDLILLVCNCAKKRIQEGLTPDVSEQTKTCSLGMDTQQDLHCDDSIDDTDNELMIMMTITLTI